MKETTLRNMIRKQIKESLKEAPVAKAAVGNKLGSVEKLAGIKMLKKALGQGTPAQQAAGLLQVVKAISGDDAQVAKQLSRMLQKKDALSGKPAGAADLFDSIDEAEVSSALASKSARVDKTQAMQMLKKTLGTKPATQQTDFVIDMINNLGLKDSAKKRLLLKMRQGLK